MSATEESVPGLPEPSTSTEELRDRLTQPHPPHRRKLGELLRESGALRDTGLHRALASQTELPGVRFGKQLLMRHEVDEDQLYRAISDQIGVPYVRLGEFRPEPAALAALPPNIVREQRVLPLMYHSERLVVATDDPADGEKLAVIRFRSQAPLEVVLATPRDLETAIATQYPAIGQVAMEAEYDAGDEVPAISTTEPPAGTSIEALAREKPIVRLVHTLLSDAILRRASDIHIRPHEKFGDAHYRIDGAMVRVGELHRALLPGMVARIKVLAEMNLAEHRLPQDGSIHFRTANGQVDMRVSIMPTVYGENVVIRLLDPRVGLRRLDDIGFSDADSRKFRRLIDRNQGLVLVTGPTGCGKSTTLYAALQTLNTGEYHILTVEDPVEYRIDGVVQIQVNNAIHLDFARVLRNILRHDPDIILVGEVRDAETAKIAVESALTGHLVLSSLHTNSAAQTVTRLVEIGIPPYLVNATLAGVLAQRLVRRNCRHCRVEEEVNAEIREVLGVGPQEKFWRGAGCSECSGTGTAGRVAVYELLEMTAALRKLILAGVSYQDIENQAVTDGMRRLTEQALTLARAGDISLKEVFHARLE